MRYFGTVVRGVRMPVIKEGDDIVSVVSDTLMKAIDESGIKVCDRDVIGITESVVARAQGNYATIEQFSKDVRNKMGSGTVGLVFPILSRNRFLEMLKAIASGVDELIVQLSYPSDEVGNPIISFDDLDNNHVNPYDRVFTEKEFRDLFGKDLLHPFTKTDYVRLYSEAAPNIKIIFANQATAILKYTDKVICGDIHTRARTKRILKEAGAKVILGLDDFLTSSVDGSGYNQKYGVLGSNYASNGKIKLFPRDSQATVDAIQKKMFEKYGKTVEVFIYGDGAFKDPFGKIWELADPVVSPFYTSGLIGQPNELKFKLLADTEFANLKGEEARIAMTEYIKLNKSKTKDAHNSLGTTPRNLTDLLGSLCDLTSGSGDKGTPVIYIQGYFDDYTKE